MVISSPGSSVNSWGGTDIEPWMSPQALSALEKHKPKLEKLQQIGEPDAYDARWQQLQKQWNDTLENFDAGLLQKWYEPGANYNGWNTINAPGVWDRLGYKGEGVGWFVRKVHLSADAAQKPALIALRPVHNRSIVYVNGTKLDPPRRIGERIIFLVPAALLREGDNVLAVRVYKFWTFGGFIGKPADMFLSTATGNLSLAGTWHFKPGYFSRNPVLTGGPNAYIASLYQAMVHPFHLMPVKGFIWYQGENNVSRSGDYGWHLQQLIADWRRTWADTTLPFLIVQLPNFKNNDSHEANFARLRAQQQAATVVPGAHLAVTIDVGDSTDIHPKNKLPVGYRLHLLARKYAYGEAALVAEGPTPQSARRNGNTVQITFMHTGSGLQANNAHGYLYGFELAGADDVFHPAFAYINNNTVVLHSNKVTRPVKVRYAWADNPPVSLFNAEGLPAGPFVMNVSPE
ncbi:MAG: sialate O-acetylesterase [Lacibacter sp.]